MFYQAVLLLLLQSTAISSILTRKTSDRGEYATIQADAEYVPAIGSVALGDVNRINSIHQCAQQCMFSEICLTATYYEDLKTCRLFSASVSPGAISDRAKAGVLDFSDRMPPRVWYLTGNMTSVRDFHKSTFVASMNAVQIVGGSDGYSELSSTETFFTLNGSFSRRTDTSVARWLHTADCLDGRLMVIAGGWSSAGTAELYDPLMGMPNRTVNLTAPRSLHASSIIDDGGGSSATKLLLVGGKNGTEILSTGDVFDMGTGMFTAVSNKMNSTRCYHTATAIGNGYVLLAGGINNDSVILDSLELYSSTSNLFVPLLARMSTGRAYHTATYIPSRQAVLFVGGQSQTGALQTYDLFDVTTWNFTVLNGSALNARAYHTATLLLNQQVLITGGMANLRLSSCELYNPVSGTFTIVANMSTDRADHTATLLANTGQVLACGGQTQNGTVLNSCELYQP